MAPDLAVPFTHGRAVQIVHSLQNGVLTKLLLDVQHGFLQGFLAFQLAGVGEEVHLQNALIRTVRFLSAIRSNSSTVAAMSWLLRLVGLSNLAVPCAPFGTVRP